MKINLTFVTIGIALALVFFVQKSQVKELNQEQGELHQSLAKKRNTSHFSQESALQKSIPQQQTGKNLEKAAELLSQFMNSSFQVQEPYSLQQGQELSAQLFDSFIGLSHQDVLSIIPNGPYDFSKLEDNEENLDPKLGIVAMSTVMLAEQNPKEAILLIREIISESTNHGILDGTKASAFQKWSRSSPEEALAWYEQEKATGATDLKDLETFILAAKALINPEEALKIALQNEEPQALNSALQSLQYNIKDLAGHRLLLEQLNTAHKTQPELTTLTEFRANYLRSLNQELIHSEHYEDAVEFVAKNYSPEEQKTFAGRISRTRSLAEPKKWADWLLEHGDQKETSNFVASTWGTNDPEAAATWLEQQPEGVMKQKIVIEYAFQLANTDKASATQWAQTLPDSEKKQKLLRQIEER